MVNHLTVNINYETIGDLVEEKLENGPLKSILNYQIMAYKWTNSEVENNKLLASEIISLIEKELQ